jgi:hypothetical protein
VGSFDSRLEPVARSCKQDSGSSGVPSVPLPRNMENKQEDSRPPDDGCQVPSRVSFSTNSPAA